MNTLGKMVTIMLLIFSLSCLSGCQKEPIKIGFIGSLTSKSSQLSIDARNAIELGIDQINETGGINGHKIEFVVKDDGENVVTARERHLEFVDEKVKLILGHMTSNMAEVVLESQSEALMFLSPSMSASSLTGKDDFFLRSSPLTDNQAVTFFELAERLKVKDAVILYDIMNAEYTENLAKYTEVLNESMYRINLKLIAFDSRIDNLDALAKTVLNEQSEMVFMISQAIDTAVLSQILKNNRPELVLCSVSWSMTEDLILNGGSAIDQMYFVGVNKPLIPSDQFIDFQNSFFDRFQYQPSFVSLLAYDALNVLIDALNQAEDYSPMTVKQAILDIGTFEGLDETFDMDLYGDNNRKYMIYQLIENKFIPLYR